MKLEEKKPEAQIASLTTSMLVLKVHSAHFQSIDIFVASPIIFFGRVFANI